MSCEFGTKAETLEVLKKAGFNIPSLYYFSLAEWDNNSNSTIEAIQHAFPGDGELTIVRSSSLAEDNSKTSQAGAFKSIMNINPKCKSELRAAVETVFASYNGSSNDQVLIQSMVKNIGVSGVIMTRCLQDGSPYYVINYDDESGKTDSITGGTGVSKTIYIYKGVEKKDFDSSRVRAMMNLVRKLESVFSGVPLDIEFAIDKKQVMHLFQVRRICTCQHWKPDVENIVSDKIAFVEQFVSRYLKKRAGLFGEKSILGVMPDWNPAEIIGITPRPLAASLYREIITRKNWSRAREEMGYRKMPPEELMILVAGRPYIDIRNSFNSFLPEGLNSVTAEKIINAWLDYLDRNPQYHDKVEFEVATTIYDPCFEEDFKTRYPKLLSTEEFESYKQKLLSLTNENLLPGGTLQSAYNRIATLVATQKKYPDIDRSNSVFEVLAIVKQLLEDCSKFGTLPFSIIARHGFIAETFLRAIIRKKGLSKERVNIFKRSIETVSGEMSKNFRLVCAGKLGKDVFLEKYGHLRPGTYDILSPRYLDRRDLFLDVPDIHNNNHLCQKFHLSQKERDTINKIFSESGITAVNADQFMDYAGKAIAGREYGKFVFTRNLSNALEGISYWGELIGLDKHEISFLNISEITDSLFSQLDGNIREHFIALVDKGKHQYELANSFKLSYLIRSSKDVYIVPQHRCTPNFITTNKVEAPVVKVNTNYVESQDLDGCVVCIESADPGYDWIFTRSIAGLVTKYGGTNSHMAIRCAEYGLPAAIGCGELLFDKISSAQKCTLDAGQQTLSPASSGADLS
ncbi:PEP/pyruvate-binding domain-containing protein [Maridesulfovibrio zosterae]|uniref:PEP/pyruvate-binding domain-containing protein n=1 Tax=Maridesulfovibrio zosterae TaxID=82171 RepID=UPI00040B9E1C|nr:PEP/pyruvate-binding domain-containing protein [Maridesulfovibrio zosterae]